MSSLSIPAATLGDAPNNVAANNVWTVGMMSEGLALSGPTRWCIPQFKATATTPTIRVERNLAVAWDKVRWASIPEYQTTNPFASVKVPWREVWRVAEGTDGMVIVWLPDGGRYEILNLRRAAVFFGPYVCDHMHYVPPLGCNPETHTVRGAGQLSRLDGLLTVDMLDAGLIPTALSFAARNVQFGPDATYVAPATRVEHRKVSQRADTGMDPLLFMNPGGTRFRLDVTDNDIARWLDSRGYPTAKRRTAGIVAIALRDYGICQTTTCALRPYIETEGMLNASTATAWREHGLTTMSDFRTLLDGLVTVDRLKVVNPA